MEAAIQSLAHGRDALRALKNHDNFLTQMRITAERDEQTLKEDIEQKLDLA